MITIDDIRKLGLQEKDAKVYLALLRTGGGLPAAIAKDAGVNRATTYEVLTRLHERGLVMKMVKKNKYYFSCAEPDAFSEYLEKRRVQINKQQTEFERLLPQLNYFYSHSPQKPKIMFYDSAEGIRDALFHSLEGGHEDVIAFTSLRIINESFDKRTISAYAAQSVKRGTKIRYLDYDVQDQRIASKFISEYFARSPKEYVPRVTYVKVPRPVSNVVTIYANFVSIIDVRKPEVMAVIIENEDIADTFRMMFEAAWSKQTS